MFWKKTYYTGPKSDHFDGDQFFLPKKPIPNKSLGEILKWRFCNPHVRWPKQVYVEKAPAPSQRIGRENLKITNIGHATFLIQGDGLNIITDPQFSQRAGPFSWLGPKRIQRPGISLEQLPPIDLIFVSHNHYDHLDLPSLKWICERDHPQIITPLGNDQIIQEAAKNIKIKTLDWCETISISSDVSFKLLPSQHWSARTPFDRNKALWGAGCFYFKSKTFLFVGDTGFDAELFHQLKGWIEKPIDVAALPIGCYKPRWFMSPFHMSPEEAWEGFKILQGNRLIPHHFDVFHLADEDFGEAVNLLKASARSEEKKLIILKTGDSVTI